MELESLSVINRAAILYSGMRKNIHQAELDSLGKLRDKLYEKKSAPFLINANFDIPLHLLSPRLRNLLESDEFEARKLWEFICARENVIRMITATEMENTAAEALSYRFEEYYDIKHKDLNSFIQFKQIIGYMIKIIMELNGYVVQQKRVKIGVHPHPKTQKDFKYFTTASRYRKLTDQDLESLTENIKDVAERQVFIDIFKLITEGQTQYQKRYALDDLTSWDVLVKSNRSK